MTTVQSDDGLKFVMKTILNFNTELLAMKECWKPETIAESDNHIFKLVKIQGDFTWHIHETDKVLIVFEGDMLIKFRDPEAKAIYKEDVQLNKGDMYLVPGNTDHKPYSEKGCGILIIEVKDKELQV